MNNKSNGNKKPNEANKKKLVRWLQLAIPVAILAAVLTFALDKKANADIESKDTGIEQSENVESKETANMGDTGNSDVNVNGQIDAQDEVQADTKDGAQGNSQSEVQTDKQDKVTVTPAVEQEKEPQIKADVDLTVEENEQKSVDEGHSPWKLDPVFVAQVYASLLVSPEGIVGDYPIAYEDIKIIESDDAKAIAEIDSENTVAKYIYLERLVRQDETGIWTVTGYDPAD